MESSKIRVLECIRQGKIGGGESHLLSVVQNIDRSKFDPVVLSFTPGPMLDQLKQMNVDNYVIYTERPFDVSKWKKVKDFLVQQKIDIIHAHGTRANSNIIWAARSLDIPVVYTIHGWSFHPDQHFLLRKLRIMGESYLTNRTHTNISVSMANQRAGKKYVKKFSSVLINYGVDQNKFNANNIRADIRSELGIPESRVLVLFIARFTKQKQPIAMVQAFADALKKNKNLHLLMVGDGELRAEVEKLVNQYLLAENVTLQPFRQDVPDILGAADIYALPSLWEGLPIGLLEAMSMGKAIIASKVDGTPEVITHEENGLLICTDNLIHELAEALLHLSDSEEKRRLFGERALKTVEEGFNAVDMTRKIENVYTGILDQKNNNKGETF